MVEKVPDVVFRSRRVKVEEITNTLTMFTECVHCITPIKKRERARISIDNVKLFNINPADFLCHFVRIIETWLHYYVPDGRFFQLERL